MKNFNSASMLASAIAFGICSFAEAAPWSFPQPASDLSYYADGHPDEQQVELGRILFYDKILSGNMNISCATCHHSLTGTGDGLALPIGEGGKGLGVTRDTGTASDAVHERVPRNAPPVFNLGAKEFRRMFHDGRVEPDANQPSGFISPAGDDLPYGLDNPLAVQAMFPVTSGAEMAGQKGENAIANSSAAGQLAGPDGVWALLAGRLQDIPEYVDLFVAAFADVGQASDITFVHAANAMAAFEASSWRADNSRFDKFLRGRTAVLSRAELRGARVFYKTGSCASCHSGTFQTDHEFHAIAMPQVGPGKGDGFMGQEDYGRERVTGDESDRFKFRTPTLRNVALTAPYGHSGSYDTLEGVVRHHLDSIQALYDWDAEQLRLPHREDLDALDLVVMNNPELVAAIADASELDRRMRIRDKRFNDLIAFLHTLTDTESLDMRADVPDRVPSGLPLAE